MTDTTPGNNVGWRLTVVERRLERLEEGKPDVIAERVTRLALDVEALRRDMFREMEELRSELASQRKILIGFFVSFALLAVGIALSYILGGGGGVTG